MSCGKELDGGRTVGKGSREEEGRGKEGWVGKTQNFMFER